MINTSLIFAIICCLNHLYPTTQRPDYLKFSEYDLQVDASYAYASPVELYFFQNRLEYPFDMLSTANYRGHIAYWRLEDGLLLLDSLDVDGTIKYSDDYDIGTKKNETGRSVIADWFNGMISAK